MLHELLRAAGTLRASYENVDWSGTTLGSMSSWSPALRSAVDLALHTRFPVTLLWGPEFVLVYNEAYVPLIAEKHPAALGARARDVFPEAWETIGPMMESVLAGEGATWVQDESVPLRRRGLLEEAYFTFSYSPVRGTHGGIEGVLDIATETTRQVIDRRRLELLSRLRRLLGDLERVEDVLEHVLPLLRGDVNDFAAVECELEGELGGRTSITQTGARWGVEDTPTGRVARFALGSAPNANRRPVLVVELSKHLVPDETYIGFLRLVAAVLGEALDRIKAQEAERGMSEALQRTLLSEPMQPDNLKVAVRYLAAAEQVQVGGDWYDSYMGPDGALRLVVGDVTGHDRRAVAAMAQARNLMRGVSYASQGSPATVLSTLDDAMYGLGVDLYATAILAQVEQEANGSARPSRTLRWSNAGHPPPVLIRADGRTELLERPSDALLGLGRRERDDHAVLLEGGDTVVFYTDGLVERRGIPLQQRLEWLTSVLHGRQELSAEELCDHMLAQLGNRTEDDVALLVLRVDGDGHGDGA